MPSSRVRQNFNYVKQLEQLENSVRPDRALLSEIVAAPAIDAMVDAAPFSPDTIKPKSAVVKQVEKSWRTPNVAEISWYGDAFQGKLVTGGKRVPQEYRLFDKRKWTAANWDRALLGKKVKITFGDKAVVLLITDRGPHPRLNRDFDVTERAAAYLGFKKQGVAKVTAELVDDFTPLGPA